MADKQSMNRFAMTFLVSLATALSSCAARVVSYPHAASVGTIAAQSNENESGGGTVPVDSEMRSEDFIEPLFPEVDESYSAENPSDAGLGSSDDSGVAESTYPEPDPSPTPEPPAFLAERPAGEHSGPVPILIDAPDGSTVTYSLDRNDAIEAPMSFVLDDVSPGDHVLEIVVYYPNGDTTTLQHHWTQLPDQVESSDEKSDSQPEKKKKEKRKKEKRKKEKRTPRNGEKSKENKSKENKSKENKSSTSGKSGKN